MKNLSKTTAKEFKPMTELYEILAKAVGSENIEKDADMSKEVSFRAGGKADILVRPQNREQLIEVLSLLSKEDVNHLVMGNGSNLLIKDGGYRGVVVKISSAAFSDFEILKEENGYVYVRVGAGMLMGVLARKLADNSLAGFEFASGIPGSLGGAVFMNAGAYDGEIKDIIVSAEVIDKDGTEIKTVDAKDMELSYRHSIFHNTGDVIISAELKFKQGNKEEIEAKMAELGKRRNEKQPVNYPSAGSFFKRPEGYFAGKLVQDAGLKGYTVGGAQVSELHSGFVINIGGATASDIVAVMKHCQKEVYDKFGVNLEPEVRILGED